jgi:hypothetical protein
MCGTLVFEFSAGICHSPASKSICEIRIYLQTLYQSNIRRQFKLALHQILLTLVRKSELIFARWELDLGIPWTPLEAGLFADAEFAEDEIQDVVAGGGAGERVEGAEGVIEVEEDHLVGDGVGGGLQGAG